MSILISVINQKMVISSCVGDLVTGSHNFVKFRFNLDENWDGLSTIAQFRQGDDAYEQPLNSENCAYLPSEIGAGTCILTLYGTKGTTIGTANSLTFKVIKSDLVSDAQTPGSGGGISPGGNSVLLSKIEALEERIDEIESDISYKGEDGITPHIGDNGNWFIGDEDTGVKAEGKGAEDIPTATIDTEGLVKLAPKNKWADVSLDENSGTAATPRLVFEAYSQIEGLHNQHVLNGEVHVSTEEKQAWGAKSDFSGNYADLTGKPTKLSQFQNDTNFINSTVSDLFYYYTKSDTYTKEEVNALVSAIPKFSIEVVPVLPTENISTTTIYLVPGGSGNNLYTEYIYTGAIGSKWEVLGAQTVDLTGYATEQWVHIQLADYLPESELDAAITAALAEAKASGEFDGAPGEPGKKGDDGYSPTVSISKSGKVTTVTITDKDGAKTFTINDGEDGHSPVVTATKSGKVTSIKVDGVTIATINDGENGKDGVSVTHSWNGTSLTITSASGTSTVNLKGEPGDDYVLTDADKAEIAGQAAEQVEETLTNELPNDEAFITAVINALPDTSGVNY